MKCGRCAGCGKIDDGDAGEPWSAWEALPAGSNLAVVTGIVKPIECPDCNGTGVVMDRHEWSIQVGDFTNAKKFTDLEEFLREVGRAIDELKLGKTIYLKKIAVFLPHD